MAKVILDAGHGGADPGAVYEGRQEKDDNLRLALAVGDILEDNGVEVAYTRTEDVYDTPLQKARIANSEGGDFFVSIHRNSSPEPNQYSGVETLVYDRSGKKLELAEAINEELAETGFRNLGVRERPGLIVLRRTEMPAVLVEAGFLNTEADNLLFDEEFDQIVQAIANGVLRTLEEEEQDITENGSRTESRSLSEPDTAPDTPGSRRSMEPSVQSITENGENTRIRGQSTVGRRQNEAGNGQSAAEREQTALYRGQSVSAIGQGTPDHGQNVSASGQSAPESGRNAVNRGQSASESGQSTPGQGQNTPGSGQTAQNRSAVAGTAAQEEETDSENTEKTGEPAPSGEQESESIPEEAPQPRVYRVQTGAFRNCANAQGQLYRLRRDQFPSYILQEDGYYKVQTGAYLRLDNAVQMEEALRKKGYQTFITT